MFFYEAFKDQKRAPNTHRTFIWETLYLFICTNEESLKMCIAVTT